MTRPPNAIDFWRGFALVTIFVNHIPGNFWGEYTHRQVSLSDSAELFVFLAGVSLRNIVGRPGDPTPGWRLALRLGGRAVTLYAAHILIISVAIALLATASILLENPLLLEWHNASSVFQNPVETHVGLVLLTHQLGYFDILPLYVVLMLCAPAFALIDRHFPAALLPVSFAIYLAALATNLAAPTWPVEGRWVFNPLSWQFIFVMGFVSTRHDGPMRFVENNLTSLRLISIPIVVGSAFVVQFSLWPDPTRVPWPPLFFLIDKTFVTPLRVIQFLALIILFSALYPYIERFSVSFCEFFSQMGRNSLEVFCVGSILSLVGQILRYAFAGSLIVDTLVVICGIACLSLTAWMTEWRARLRSARPAIA